MKERIIATLVSWIMRALASLVRFRIHDNAGYLDPSRATPFVIAGWHNSILLQPYVFQKYRHAKQRIAVLTSASRDGGLLAAVVGKFKMENVRGSSSRRGAIAVRELHAKLAEGCDIAITPDGPRGPVYSVNAGIIHLAAQTQLPMMVFAVSYSSFWELKSWDRFRVPKPFSRVDVTFVPLGKLVLPIETEEQRDAARAWLAKELHSATGK